MRVSEVRDLIATTLEDLGIRDPKPIGERLVLSDRFSVGCRFDFEGASAIWLSDAGQIRFFGRSGELLKIIRVNRRTTATRLSA
jgi:hypothetical protein